MSDQAWSMLIGFGVVVGLRVLDWIMPKGYVWVRVREWSVRDDNDDSKNNKPQKEGNDDSIQP